MFVTLQISYLLGLAFNLSPVLCYTLLAIGCCPSSPPTNFIAMLLRGDIALSTVMTLISNLISIGPSVT